MTAVLLGRYRNERCVTLMPMWNDSESCRNPSHVIEVNGQVWYRVNTEATNLGTCGDVIYRLANTLAAMTVALYMPRISSTALTSRVVSPAVRP